MPPLETVPVSRRLLDERQLTSGRRGVRRTGRSRKQPRFDEFARVLWGGQSDEQSAFTWPFVPKQTKESVKNFFITWHRYLAKLYVTRIDDHRGHRLSNPEVAEVNRLINFHLSEMLKFVAGLMFARWDPLSLLKKTLNFVNVLLVTNRTKNTTIQLPHSALVHEIPLAYGHSRAIRPHQLYGDSLVEVLDWRSGGRSQRTPLVHTLEVRDEAFEVEQGENMLRVRIIVDHESRDKDVLLDVEWIGPMEGIDCINRKGFLDWAEIANIPRRSYVEEDPQPKTAAFHTTLATWMPYIRQLGATKHHLNVDPAYYVDIFADIDLKFLDWERLSRSRMPEDVCAAFCKEFANFMQSIRIDNLTEGTVVVFRTPSNTYAITAHERFVMRLHKPEPILAAEVHVQVDDETDEVIPIKADMLTFHGTATLHVKIRELATLQIAWFGPGLEGWDSRAWAKLMTFI